MNSVPSVLLSTQCRLREVHRGDTICSWTVEQHQDAGWVEISTVGLVLVRFWRRKTVVYLQNRYIREQPGLRAATCDRRSS